LARQSQHIRRKGLSAGAVFGSGVGRFG